MKLLTVTALVCWMTVPGWAQPAANPFPNPVRPMPAPINASPFGNILYPGGVPNFPSAVGASVRGNPPYTGVQPGGPRPGPGNGGYGRPGRTVVVPYAVPVYYGGGYGYDPYYQQQAQPNVTVVVPQQPAPSVIINQTFNGVEVPEAGGLRIYESPGPQSRSAQPKEQAEGKERAENTAASQTKRSYARDEKANIYLIVLKDSTVREAIGYWVEANTTLAYVTPEASIGRVSLDHVDRDASVQVNAQRKLEFELRPR